MKLGVVGYWAWGSALVVVSIYILTVLWFASGCVKPASDIGRQLMGCEGWWVGPYIVIREWQTGFGALIGFGGIAWSTFYNKS